MRLIITTNHERCFEVETAILVASARIAALFPARPERLVAEDNRFSRSAGEDADQACVHAHRNWFQLAICLRLVLPPRPWKVRTETTLPTPVSS